MLTPAHSSLRTSLAAALRPVALIGAIAGITSTYADTDLWGHLRFGLDILDSGHIATGVDPYSFTQDRAFVYHEWLGGTIMAAAYRGEGVAGLVALKALLAAAILGLVWVTVKPARFAWRWGAMALTAWGTLTLVLTLRPQLWTGLFVVVLCRLLTSRSSSTLWALPPLFALWANLHGGWIVGGALVAVWTAAAFVDGSERRWRLLIAAAASLGATLLNPYGVDLWLFLLATVRLGRDNITEWEPVWRAGAPFIVLWTMTLVTIAASLRRCSRPPIAVLVALGALAYAAARVNRMGPLFVLATVTLLSRQWPREEDARRPAASVRAALDACAVAVVIAVAVWLQDIPRCITYRYAFAPDAAAAEALRGARGRLVTSFDWGEYAIWHFGPALKVSIDARRETLYTDRTLNEQLAIWRGDPAGLSALARIRPEYVWLPVQSRAAADWLRQHGYREDVRTDRSFVAVRSDLPPVPAWHGFDSQCFPGP